MLSTAAHVLAGGALWRAGYSRLAITLLVTAGPLLNFAPAIPSPGLVFPVDMLGSVLLLLSGTVFTLVAVRTDGAVVRTAAGPST